MKLLLTGSSGFIGKQFTYYNSERFDIINLSNLDNLDNSVFKGVNTIVHLAGLTNISSQTSFESFLESNLEITKNLASTAKEAKVKQFIFLSTVKVYDSLISPKIDEKSKCNPLDPYGRSKHLAEIYLRDIETPDFKVSIIRSPVVYGPGVKGRLLKLIKFSDTPFPLPFKNANLKFSAVFVGNLIQLINRIVKKNAKGVFLAKDKESRSLFDFLFLVRGFLNREKRFFNMPLFFLPFIKNFNPSFFQNITNPIEIDNSITNKVLGFNPPYSMRYGVHKTIKWYKRGS